MLLLTWHGTILRVEQTNRRLTHAKPVPVRPISHDFNVELPAGFDAPHPVAGGLEAVPAARPGLVHLRRGEAFLRVEPHAAFPLCDCTEPGEAETLLPLTEAEAQALRTVLEGAWRRQDTGEHVPQGGARLASAFTLLLGELAVDLATARPAAGPDGVIVLAGDRSALTLVPAEAGPFPQDWHLRPRPPEHRPREVADSAALRATPDSRLVLPSPPERLHLPMAITLADRNWLYRNPWVGQEPEFGRRHFQSEAVHEADRFVLLERHVEGMIFGPDGVSNTHGYVGNLTGDMPPNMGREAGETFISTAALLAAPRLRGPHAVFYGGNMTNYYHWIIDAMLPLSLLRPHLPDNTTLLLPGTLAQMRARPNGLFDHVQMLEAFGFGDMQRVEVAAQVCHVEDVYWADKCFIEQVSAADLETMRNRALGRLPPPGKADRLIYIRRATSRRVANEPATEQFVRQAGFDIYTMEDLTVAEQIELFRHATFVIGTHGAALANLVFCPPGTCVIELAPDCGYRPFFALISSKLNLVHGILPCPTSDGGFFGHLQVDLDKLRALRRMLENRV